MRIGIDFDNTIVTYDDLFHKYALEYGVIDEGVEKNKQAIRDTVRKVDNGEDIWIELQAVVYGYRMHEANIAEGIENFFEWCADNSIPVSIISHKTEFSAHKPPVNLRKAAWNWIESKNFYDKYKLKKERIFFEGTLKEKLQRIVQQECTHFIDDLLELLTHEDFPTSVEKNLYAPLEKGTVPKDINHHKSWSSIYDHFAR